MMFSQKLDLLKTMGFAKTTSILSNRTTSRFEAHLIFKHTQKPDFLISNAHLHSRLYGICSSVENW